MADAARLEQLRRRTRDALALHADKAITAADPAAAWSTARLLEELQLYQAELEAQNEELRLAQQTVSRALAQYTVLFQSLPLPALVVDFSGIVLQSNQQAVELFRFTQKSALGHQSLYRLLSADSAAAIHGTLRNRTSAISHKLNAIELTSRLQRAAQDVYIIHLSTEFHLDDHVLAIFVDRAADIERERQGLKTQALLDLRSTAATGDESALLDTFGDTLERLTGAYGWRVYRHTTDSKTPQLLARAGRVSSIESWLDQIAQTTHIRIAPGTLRIHRLPPNAVAASAASGRDETREWHAFSAAVAPLGAPTEHLTLTLARATGAFTGEQQAAAMTLVQELADLLERISRERQVSRLSQALTQSVEGIFITDLLGSIQYVNPGFSRLTGYGSAEVVGKPAALLKSGHQEAEFYEQMWATLKLDGVWQGEIMNRNRDGATVPHWLSLTTIRSSSGEPEEYIGALIDLSSRKADEEKIHQLAYFDPLTGLPNRRLLIERIRLAIAMRHRSGETGALLFIDLDDFKRVNDTLGHEQGDVLLQHVAREILACVREVDVVARLGGDEFVVLMEFPGKDLDAAAGFADRVGHKVMNAISKPVVLLGRTISVTPSIGIAMLDDLSPTVEHILKNADLAMYRAKGDGRNAVRFFNPSMQAEADARSSLEGELQHAIDGEQFVLHYQPQCDSAGKVVGYEALLRWQHPERGLLRPADFIPLAEQTGLILRVGRWVVDQAGRQLAQWAKSAHSRDWVLSINVSARQFRDNAFVEAVVDMLRTSGANPKRLELELTEYVLLDNIEAATTKMRQLRNLGISLSLDDFGTGYSSLAYLQQLPLSKLKIDERFVQGAADDPANGAITRTIIGLARSIGLQVLAEGVENEAQFGFLLRHGCDLFQGYYFGVPVPIEQIK